MNDFAPPRRDDRRARPDGLCACGVCGGACVLFAPVAPSIEDCVSDRPLGEQLRAAHQVQTAS